jgi:YD repeat-containing protein
VQISYGAATIITDSAKHVRVDEYDTHGALASQSNAAGSSTSTYDAQFNRTSTTDANGNTTGYIYNRMGQPEVITDALAGTTRMTYDDRNHLVSTTDAVARDTGYQGNLLITTTDPLSGTVVSTYDAQNLLVQTVDPASRPPMATTGLGKRAVVTGTLGSATTSATTRWVGLSTTAVS